MRQTTSTASRIKRWTLFVGSALVVGYLFGRVAATL